eukprot:229100-Amphidinium_carterae.1
MEERIQVLERALQETQTALRPFVASLKDAIMPKPAENTLQWCNGGVESETFRRRALAEFHSRKLTDEHVIF